MQYCPNCGKAVPDGGRFCTGCGANVGGHPQGTLDSVGGAPASVTKVVVVTPKRAGRLAVKGFLLSLVLAVIGGASLETTKAKGIWNVIAWGAGAAYILTNLRKWKHQNEAVEGTVIAWTVAVFLILACMGGLISTGFRGTGGSSSSFSTTSGLSSSMDPKAEALRNLKLDFKWRKQGFGNVMIADFTLWNPTQYSFKDFEIQCTHYAPSGTRIDSNTRTIYEIVAPHSTKHIKEMNMGFIHSQAAGSGCVVTDLIIIP